MCQIMEDYIKEKTAEKDAIIANQVEQLANKDEEIAMLRKQLERALKTV